MRTRCFLYAVAVCFALTACTPQECVDQNIVEGPDEQGEVLDGEEAEDESPSNSFVVPVSAVNSDDYVYLQKKSPKRGVSFGWNYTHDLDLLGPYISWHYNWGAALGNEYMVKSNEYGLEYCPMCWNNNYNETNIKNWFNANSSSKHLLAFNEPNLTDQANMTPSVAAGYWTKIKNLAKDCHVKLVSPAMNWGTLNGYNDPVKWLNDFFNQSAVSVNDVDAIAMHNYMTSAAALMGDIAKYKIFGKKIWLTEFSHYHVGSYDGQMTFMSQCINALEKDDDVERYAWFIPRGNQALTQEPYVQLLTKGSNATLSDLGKVFTQLSTFDKTAVYPMNARIPAAHYADCSIDGSYKSVTLIPSTDDDGIAVVQGLAKDMWMDYQVNFTAATGKIHIRYATVRDSELSLYTVDAGGNEGSTPFAVVSLPRTGDAATWVTAEAAANYPTGTQMVRVECSKGNVRVNWIDFTTR